MLAGRLVQLQGLQPSAYADHGVQRTREITVPALRGSVLDRNGNVLALSVQASNVFANPRLIAAATCPHDAGAPCDSSGIAAALAPVLHVAPATLRAKLDFDKAFVYLKKGIIDATVAKRITGLKLPGIGLEPTTVRLHPSHSLAAGVLGYTYADGTGAAGIEKAYQGALAGVPGKTVARMDALGRVIPTGSDSHLDPVPGKDIRLTIDEDLQWYAQDLLAKQVQATQAKNGTIVVMDVHTGELLAFASAPSYDPDHHAGDSGSLRGISEVYEPGSVNKVITAAAALQRGIVTPNTVIDVPPTYRVSNKTLHDAEKHGLEHLTFTGVLAKSSNIGTVKVAQRVGADRLYSMMRAFGFGAKSGVDLPGDSRGLLPKPQ
ncbi:MAG: peptidoglycan D,D-transpeptidase FtsI family protein, partial [Mycobacteriales bacterium]